MSAVLQEWVQALPWKMQSVLIAAMRGPDDVKTLEIKKLSRWLRITCQENADPQHTFMQSTESPDVAFEDLSDELEYRSWHYMSHLLYALEIIAYHGPEREVRIFAAHWYTRIVHDVMHLSAETQDQMDVRLHDKVEHD